MLNDCEQLSLNLELYEIAQYAEGSDFNTNESTSSRSCIFQNILKDNF